MAKYNYWHVITEIRKDYSKFSKLKVGMIITHSYKKDGEFVDIVNLKDGKCFDKAYKLAYLGRLLKGLEGDDLTNPIYKWVNEKGYKKIVDEYENKKLN